MNKLLVPTLCVLVGCAAGAMMPAVTAQWPDNPQAPRWQAECVEVETGFRDAVQRVNTVLQARTQQGWEPWYVYSLQGSAGTSVQAVCFKRPAP